MTSQTNNPAPDGSPTLATAKENKPTTKRHEKLRLKTGQKPEATKV
jgi:hypothetical protein